MASKIIYTKTTCRLTQINMGLFSRIRSGLYKTAKLMGDASAIKKGNILQRVKNRVLGRITGKILGKISRKN